jgi:hypothetical protein
MPIPTELLQGFVSLSDLARRLGPREPVSAAAPANAAAPSASQVGAAAAAQVLPTDPRA